jgi:hypothetical protein
LEKKGRKAHGSMISGSGVLKTLDNIDYLCRDADEELDALFGTVDTEMALAIALLLLGRGQRHHRPIGYGVTDRSIWLHRNLWRASPRARSRHRRSGVHTAKRQPLRLMICACRATSSAP